MAPARSPAQPVKIDPSGRKPTFQVAEPSGADVGHAVVLRSFAIETDIRITATPRAVSGEARWHACLGRV